MMRPTSMLVPFFVSLFACLAACTEAAAQDGDRGVAFLQKRAVPFSLASPDDDKFEDLMPLAERFSKLRCIALGEAQHGDGTTFVAKYRLVRFLHEKCGFDVLVFESGMWDCDAAWAAMKRGGGAVENARQGVFGVWTQSLQCLKLWEYVQARAKSERPLEFTGFDCQLTGAASEELPAALSRRIAAISKLEQDAVEGDLREVYAALSNEKIEPAKELDKVLDRIARALSGSRKTDEGAYLLQCVASLRGAIAARRARRAKSESAKFNPRDRAMAENLAYLLEKRYPKRKLILWAATMHVLRRAEGIRFPPMKNYRGVKPMGSYTAKALRNDYYVVGFDTFGGETGFPWQAPRRVQDAPRNSFAWLAKKAGLRASFVEVRGAKGDHPLKGAAIARPLGHAPMRAKWAQHLDAMVYLDTMQASRSVPSPEVLAASKDPVAAFIADWSSSKRRIAAGNVYAEKGDPSESWATWVRLHTPSEEARRAARKRFEEWVEAQPSDRSLRWRVGWMRAAIAQSFGDDEAAKKGFEDAIKAYPDRQFQRPMIMSGFQHLINAAAEDALRSEGLSAAIAVIASPLAKDERFDYFYVVPWSAKLDPAQKRRFAGAIKRALEKRARAFPDDADAIRSQIDELSSALGG